MLIKDNNGESHIILNAEQMFELAREKIGDEFIDCWAEFGITQESYDELEKYYNDILEDLNDKNSAIESFDDKLYGFKNEFEEFVKMYKDKNVKETELDDMISKLENALYGI